MPRRSSFTVAHSWAELAADLARRPVPDLVIADVDPAVAGWGANFDALHAGFAHAEGHLAEVTSFCTLVWATNSTRLADTPGPPARRTPGGNRLLVGARKPLPRNLGLELDALRFRRTVVTGDQWLIDGLLARRFHAHFVLWKDPRPSPVWARLQYALGWLIVRPLFKRGVPETTIPAS